MFNHILYYIVFTICVTTVIFIQGLVVQYDKLPFKEVTMIPWKTVCIDLIGQYTVTDKSGNDRILNAMTFVDPATGWFEITEIPDKTSARISQIFNSTWLARYPRPRKVIFDNGNEFKTSASNQHQQPLRTHRPMPYWNVCIKYLVTCYAPRTYSSMILMHLTRGVIS